jgi:hypothetical protein
VLDFTLTDNRLPDRRVKRAERAVQLLVARRSPGIGLEDVIELRDACRCGRDIGKDSNCHAGDQGRAQGRAGRRLHGGNRQRQDIRLHLPPQPAARPATRGADLVRFDAESIHDIEPVSQAEDNALQDRARQVSLGMVCPQSDECAARARIVRRRAVAIDVRDKKETVGANGDGFGLFAKLRIPEPASENVPPPAQ